MQVLDLRNERNGKMKKNCINYFIGTYVVAVRNYCFCI